MKKDYYEILEVARNAEVVEIKKAYRRLALQFHPDKNPGNRDAEEKFKEASEAYEVLSSPDKRQIYDQFGHQGLQGTGFHGFSGVEDIFESFGDVFEDFFNMGSRRSRRTRAQKGADLRYDLEIDFMDACFGSSKQIHVVKAVSCATCKGSGAKKGTGPSTCSHCQGTGQVRHSQGFFTISTTCPACGGAGATINDPCTECRGHGLVRETKKLEVKIPAGVDTGIRLMIHGEGEVGERGGPAGDLYVLIHVRAHDFFVREGDDIGGLIPVSMTQASLGAKISVPTLKGEEEVEIPKGLQSGEHVVLKGKGVPNLRSGRPGDQVMTVIVKTPTHLTAAQEELLREFSHLEGGEEISKDKKKKKRGLFG